MKKSKVKQKESSHLSRNNCSANWLQFLNSSGTNKAAFKITNTKKDLRVANKKPTKVVSLDCEMVANEDGQDMLARVSIVDFNMTCIYDKYVKPETMVLDYRTRFSGIRESDLVNGESFNEVQSEVKKILHNKILVGHSLRSDLNVLKFGHHQKLIRDTSLFKPFREVSDGKTPSLRKLMQHIFDETIQDGEHDSIQDASAAMKLYRKFRNPWEKSIMSKNYSNISLNLKNDEPNRKSK